MRLLCLLTALFLAGETTAYAHYTEKNLKNRLLAAGEQRRSRINRYDTTELAAAGTRRKFQDRIAYPAADVTFANSSTADDPMPVVDDPVPIVDPPVSEPNVAAPVPDPIEGEVVYPIDPQLPTAP
jgi:hypothetical protein